MYFGRMASVCERFFLRSLIQSQSAIIVLFHSDDAHRRPGMNWNQAKITTITDTAKSI